MQRPNPEREEAAGTALLENARPVGVTSLNHSTKEAPMHAVVVRVTISDPEGSERALREQVVPRVSQAPGFVAGYWTRKENGGLSMTVWESEEAANTAGELVASMAPEGVSVDSVEVREVVASA